MFQVFTASTVKVKNALHNESHKICQTRRWCIFSQIGLFTVLPHNVRKYKQETADDLIVFMPKLVCQSLVSSGRHMRYYVRSVRSATSMIGQKFVVLAIANRKHTLICWLWCSHRVNVEMCAAKTWPMRKSAYNAATSSENISLGIMKLLFVCKAALGRSECVQL